DLNVSTALNSSLNYTPDTIEVKLDLLGLQPFNVSLSVSLSQLSVLSFIPMIYFSYFLWLGLVIRKSAGMRSNNPKFIFSMVFCGSFGLLMFLPALFINAHSVFYSTFKLSINGLPLNGSFAYVLFFILLLSNFFMIYHFADYYEEMIPGTYGIYSGCFGQCYLIALFVMLRPMPFEMIISFSLVNNSKFFFLPLPFLLLFLWTGSIRSLWLRDIENYLRFFVEIGKIILYAVIIVIMFSNVLNEILFAFKVSTNGIPIEENYILSTNFYHLCILSFFLSFLVFYAFAHRIAGRMQERNDIHMVVQVVALCCTIGYFGYDFNHEGKCMNEVREGIRNMVVTVSHGKMNDT
ncbi:hypothetical protein PFISCL1PPCAC_24534, partial [Pristionchus fissidentatus]